MDTVKLRGVLIKSMLGCLIAAAAVAVATILIGKFGDTTGRALGTILVALVHIGLVFGLVSMVTSRKADPSPRSTEFVVNASIVIAVLSFITSIFAIWGIMHGSLPLRLYTTYTVALVLLLHGKSLTDATYYKSRPYITANYIFMAIVALLILGIVWSSDGLNLLNSFYGRALAASAVIDVTLSIIVAVMYRLYLQQNPALVEQRPARANGALHIILSILFFIFVVPPLLFLLLGIIVAHRL